MVSIIIPAFNAGGSLQQTITSCLCNKDFITELIIVDDFSTDNTWDEIRKYQDRFPTLIKGIKNVQKGGNNARNLGFEYSTGAFIQWLDADDLILEGKLKRQVEYLLASPSTDIAYSDWRLDIYNKEGVICKTEIKKGSQYDDYLLELLRDNWQASHSYLLRRGIAQKLFNCKGWNPDTNAAQDREYYTMAAILGARFGYVEGLFSIYNREDKLSVSRALMMTEKSKIIVELLLKFKRLIEEGKFPNTSMYLKIINTQLLYYSAVFGTEKFKFRFSDIHWSMINGKRSRLKAYIAVLLS